MMQTIQAIFGLVVMLKVFYYFIMLFLRCAGIVKWPEEVQEQPQSVDYVKKKKSKKLSNNTSHVTSSSSQQIKQLIQPTFTSNLDSKEYADNKCSSPLEATWKDELKFLSQMSPTKLDKEAAPVNNQGDFSLAEIKMAMNFQDQYDLQMIRKMQEIRQLKEIIKIETKNEIEKQVNSRLKQLLPEIIAPNKEQEKQKSKKQKKKKGA